MTLKTWFYDWKDVEGKNILQGKVTTPLQSEKKIAVGKIVFKHFSRNPLFGWNPADIKLSCVEGI